MCVGCKGSDDLYTSKPGSTKAGETTPTPTGTPDSGPGHTPPLPPHEHSWGAWIITAVEGTEKRICAIDNAHQQTRLTGTTRFTFEAIGSASWRVRKGTVTSGEMIIPDYYRPGSSTSEDDFLPVTEIGAIGDAYNNGAFDNLAITAVYIPAGVTSMGGTAFRDCTSLTAVTIPEDSQLTRIGNDAFLLPSSSTTSITGIAIPAGVTAIGNTAFQYCRSLATVTFAKGSQLTSIGRSTFLYCTGLTTITLEECSQLTSIGDRAFESTGITSITIPAGVTNIDNGTFRNCVGLTTITFAEGSLLNNIGANAFQLTSSTSTGGITGIAIPAGVTNIGNEAFCYCGRLTTVIFAEGSQLVTIGNSTFAYTKSVTSITIPASVINIYTWAFQGWTNAQTIRIEGKTQAGAQFGSEWNRDCSANIIYLGL
jgi:hypothetical protein